MVCGRWASLIIAGLSTLMSPWPVSAMDYKSVMVRVYRNAIVKIDISSSTPYFDDKGNNICPSQGTGFVINKDHIVTAAHVFDIAKECGKPNIQVKSKQLTPALFAEVVKVKNDVAVLKLEKSLPTGMCALGVASNDIYEESGVRFGIPGGFEDPMPILVEIGQRDTGFKPLVVLTPNAAEGGDSGGPIIHLYTVVGILRAKHSKYPAYSFMTPAATLRDIISELNLKFDRGICNPSTWDVFQIDSLNSKSVIRFDQLQSEATFSQILKNSISFDAVASVSASEPSIKISKKSIEIQSNTREVSGNASSKSFDGFNRSEADVKRTQAVNQANIAQASERIATDVNRALWNNFIAELKSAQNPIPNQR